MIKINMRILIENSLAVIIDMQENLFAHMNNKETLENNTIKLVKGLNALDIPMIATQQYTKGLGTTIESVKELLKGSPVIEKISFSCCDEPAFIEKLSSYNKKFIIIAGIEAHVCVLQTVMDLYSRGFIPVVIEDCISSRKNSDKNTALIRINKENAIISTYESILCELCRTAGTDIFKAISKIIK